MGRVGEESKVPKQYSLRLGKMGVLKGGLDKKVGETEEGKDIVTRLSLYSWDIVEECKVTMCPASKICTYTQSGKCGVMMQYMRATSVMFFNNFAKDLDETAFYRIGMHMMPLYRMLCKLKIAEIGARRVIISGVGGRKYINPIFREIRDTIKLIDSLWKNMGLNGDVVIPAAKLGSGLNKDDYYSMLEGDHVLTKDERNLIKRNR